MITAAAGEPPDLTVVILTFNEAHHIARAIQSVRNIAREILVIDSFSSDATVTLAQALGARVIQHTFVSHAAQLQWALDHGDITTDWTMRLDADEVVEADLADEIARRLPDLPPDVCGAEVDRKHIFMGRWIRHGGRYPLRLVRLWRTGSGRVQQRWMDEHVVVHGGRTILLRGGLADMNLGDLSFFTAKHNDYASREAVEVLAARHGLFEAAPPPSTRQARRRHWIKLRIYNRLPLWAGPLTYFLQRYVVQLGFLDGRPGLVYHLLQGFWYRFLVAAKVAEWGPTLARCTSRDEQIACLSRLSGFTLGAAT
ncbi:glycosyltransferase family 2 protein [uncultured Sphingomonas sp.]|uniref:glycosyltransferase family 2 protein n=1 Tax=unclassified Sphingomonas TaxID=196159 RepID=UPI0025CDD19A|nr:glycosyltransferase family 2 protein [uncultured Sphingomonas sp.]